MGWRFLVVLLLSQGGGIYNTGTLTISGSTISGNTAVSLQCGHIRRCVLCVQSRGAGRVAGRERAERTMAEDAARGLVAWVGGARAAAVAAWITSTVGAAQYVSSVGTFAAACGVADACAEQRGGARARGEDNG